MFSSIYKPMKHSTPTHKYGVQTAELICHLIEARREFVVIFRQVLEATQRTREQAPGSFLPQYVLAPDLVGFNVQLFNERLLLCRPLL